MNLRKTFIRIVFCDILALIYLVSFQFATAQGVSLQIRTDRPVIAYGDSVRVTVKAFNPTGANINNVVINLPWNAGFSDIQTSGQVSAFAVPYWTIPTIAPLQTAVLTVTYSSVISSEGNVSYDASVTSIGGNPPSQPLSVKAVLRVNNCHIEATPSMIFDISDTVSSIPLVLSLSNNTPNILSGSWIKHNESTPHDFTNLSINSTIDLAQPPFSFLNTGAGIYDIHFTSLKDASVCEPVLLCHERKVELLNLDPVYPDTNAIADSKTGFLCNGDTINPAEFFTTTDPPLSTATRTFVWWVENIPSGVYASGGVVPLSNATALPDNALSNFSWNNTTNTPKPITFKVKVTYTHGSASVTREQTILRYVAPSVNVSIVSTGSIVPNVGELVRANTNGGWGGYSYQWSNSANTDTTSIYGAGIFSIVVTDRKGCKGFDSISLMFTPLSVTPTVAAVRCHGGNDGSITLNISGGIAPYTFLWSNGDTTQNIYNLTTGNYSVTVTAGNGVSQQLSINVPQPLNPLDLAIFGTNATCHSADNAMAWVNITGGTLPYNLSWSNGLSSDTIKNLVPGTYSVIVTDSNLCSASASISLTAPVVYSVTLAGRDSICLGESILLPFTTSSPDVIDHATYSITRVPLDTQLATGSSEDSVSITQTREDNLSALFTPTATGIYTVSCTEATDTNGCPMDIIGGSYTLYVRPYIVVANSSTHIINAGVPFAYQIPVQLPGGDNLNNYRFQIEQGQLPSGLVLTDNGTIEGVVSNSNVTSVDTVYISISKPLSCPASHMFIYRIQNSDSDLRATKNYFCDGDTSTLLITTNRTGNLTYKWSSDAGLDTALTDVPFLHIAPTSSRTYTVEILSNGIVVEVLSIDITVYPRPSVNLVLDIPNTGNGVTLGDSIVVTALPSTYPYYRFTYNGIQQPGSDDNRYATNTWQPKVNNEVSVVVRSVDGCENVAAEIFMGPEFDLPNFFNPDLERLLPGFKLDVFNRWGELLYSGSDGWNAIYRGAKVPSGTYYYVVYLRSSDGSEVSVKYHVFVKY